MIGTVERCFSSARSPGFGAACVVLCLMLTGCAHSPTSSGDAGDFPVLTGEYLGQTPPGAEPEMFAPGIVSTSLYERDVAITPDGREIYFCVVVGNHDRSAIVVTRTEGGRWTPPQIAPFSGRHDDLEPKISPSGDKFFFISKRPRSTEGEPREDFDIWVTDRTDSGWGEPYNLGPPVNTDGAEYFPSVTRDGTLYLTRDTEGGRSTILRARLGAGGYEEPVALGPEVNSTAAQFNGFVAPDESYLVFGVMGRDDSVGGVDYYVSFRDEDDAWTGPINLGPMINTPSSLEYSPYVSPDGRFFFFMAARRTWEDDDDEGLTYERIRRIASQPGNGLPDIWWVDASFLERLRPD